LRKRKTEGGRRNNKQQGERYKEKKERKKGRKKERKKEKPKSVAIQKEARELRMQLYRRCFEYLKIC